MSLVSRLLLTHQAVSIGVVIDRNYLADAEVHPLHECHLVAVSCARVGHSLGCLRNTKGRVSTPTGVAWLTCLVSASPQSRRGSCISGSRGNSWSCFRSFSSHLGPRHHCHAARGRGSPPVALMCCKTLHACKRKQVQTFRELRDAP